jgi:hypothetical protein
VSASRPLVWRKAVRDGEDLDRTALLVAHTLSTYLNGEGAARPSRELLAKGSRSSIDTVDRALRRLEAAGYLEVERTLGGGYGDDKHTNTYRVKLPGTASQDRRDEWPADAGHSRTGAAVEEGVTAAKRPSHGRKKAESRPHGCGPKTIEDVKAKTKGSALARAPATEVVTSANAQDLVAYYCDLLAGDGVPRSSDQVGHVARRVKRLVDDGVPAGVIRRALELMHERRQNPATLPSFVTEATLGPRRDWEHPVDRQFREATGVDAHNLRLVGPGQFEVVDGDLP